MTGHSVYWWTGSVLAGDVRHLRTRQVRTRSKCIKLLGRSLCHCPSTWKSWLFSRKIWKMSVWTKQQIYNRSLLVSPKLRGIVFSINNGSKQKINFFFGFISYLTQNCPNYRDQPRRDIPITLGLHMKCVIFLQFYPTSKRVDKTWRKSLIRNFTEILPLRVVLLNVGSPTDGQAWRNQQYFSQLICDHA